MSDSAAATLTQAWRVNAVARGRLLAKLTIPRELEPGTNFQDATFTVGVSDDSVAMARCRVATNGERARGTTTIGGTSFARMELIGAAAGNLYETTSYRTVRDHACYAVEYTVHSTNLGNYDPSQGIEAFDEANVEHVLSAIARSFAFTN